MEEDRALLSCAKRSPRAGFPVPATSFSLPSPCRCSARARIRGVARSSLVEAAAAGGDGVDTSDVAGDAEPRRTAAAKLMPCGVHGNAAWEEEEEERCTGVELSGCSYAPRRTTGVVGSALTPAGADAGAGLLVRDALSLAESSVYR